MSEHDPMCAGKPCNCKAIRLIRHDTMNTLYFLIDAEGKKAYDMGDTGSALALWNVRAIARGLADERWKDKEQYMGETWRDWLDTEEGKEHTRRYMLMYKHRLADNTADCCANGCPCYSTPGYYEHLYQIVVKDLASKN